MFFQGQEVLFFYGISCTVNRVRLQRSQRPKTFVEFLISQLRFRIAPRNEEGDDERKRLRLVIHCNSRKTVACKNSRRKKRVEKDAESLLFVTFNAILSKLQLNFRYKTAERRTLSKRLRAGSRKGHAFLGIVATQLNNLQCCDILNCVIFALRCLYKQIENVLFK